MTTSLRRGYVAVIAAGLVTALAAAGSAGASTYIVFLKAGVSAKAHARSYGLQPDVYYTAVANGYAATVAPATVSTLSKDKRVTTLEFDQQVAVPPEKRNVENTPQPPQGISNGVRRVGALASPTARIDGNDERVDVDVAVLDTGIQPDHPDLNVAGGYNCGPGPDWADRNGHGTMVGGFVGALDNAIGRVGIAPGVRLWGIRVHTPNTGGGVIQNSWLICGLDWVARNAATIEVANLSLGGPADKETPCGSAAKKPAAEQAICAVVERGVTVVVSAGNAATDATAVSPARMAEVITVSAIADSDGLPGGLGGSLSCLPELDDTFAFFSNFGEPVDLAAPGVCIGSTYIGSQYAVSSGTSFSAPLVAGAAALYIATHPAATPTQVRAALIARGEPGPIPEDPDEFPEPILNVAGL